MSNHSTTNFTESSILTIKSKHFKVQYTFLAGPTQNSQSSQPAENHKKKRQRRGQGRTTNIVPNIFKALIKSKDIIKKDLFNFSSSGQPKEWTKKAELILLFLKYHEVDNEERNIFATEIIKILDNMIQFQDNKMKQGEKIQFHSKNISLLSTIKNIFSRLLKNVIMPNHHEIKYFLEQVIQCDTNNLGSLVVQKEKVNKAYQYILTQIPIQNQEKELAIMKDYTQFKFNQKPLDFFEQILFETLSEITNEPQSPSILSQNMACCYYQPPSN